MFIVLQKPSKDFSSKSYLELKRYMNYEFKSKKHELLKYNKEVI